MLACSSSTPYALVWSLASAPFYVVLQLSDVEPQLRFECPAARAKAGEARPSLCPSVLSYTMRGYSRGRPLLFCCSASLCPAGPSQTGQHEAAETAIATASIPYSVRLAVVVVLVHA